MDEISEAQDQMQQMNDVLSQPIGAAADMDEDELAAELAVGCSSALPVAENWLACLLCCHIQSACTLSRPLCHIMSFAGCACLIFHGSTAYKQQDPRQMFPVLFKPVFEGENACRLGYLHSMHGTPKSSLQSKDAHHVSLRSNSVYLFMQELEAEDLDSQLLEPAPVPATRVPARAQPAAATTGQRMPAVPAARPKKTPEELELEQLEAEMAA